MNTPQQAITIANKMISSGYVYGYGFKKELVTESKINQLAKMYPSTYSSSIKQKMLTKLGKTAIDCSGFVCEAFGMSHTGSSHLKNKMIHLYNVNDSSKLQNGMIIWRNGHVGLIEVDSTGEAWVLEAKGTNYDLCRTKYCNRGKNFTYYGELKGVDYAGAKRIGQSSSVPLSSPVSSKSSILEFIDVSHHNTINLSQTATKYKDIIIRAGYRGSASGKITLDKKFLEHTQAAIGNSMNYGFYFYDQAINEKEAIQQADFMADLIEPLFPTHPIFIDSEYANKNHNGRADNISKEQRTKNLVAFCNRIIERGYKAGVYASENWFKTMVNYEQLKSYFVWVAKYSSENPSTSKYDAWQYGSANIPGSASPIDVNRLYVDWTKSGGADSSTTGSVQDAAQSSSVISNTVTASSLRVRNKSNITGDPVGYLNKDDKVNIYEYQNGWVKISSSQNKWCSYKYINSTKAKVDNCNKLNCRKSPVDGTISFVLLSGNEVNILNQDEKTGWYYIEFQGRSGYVSNKYVTL